MRVIKKLRRCLRRCLPLSGDRDVGAPRLPSDLSDPSAGTGDGRCDERQLPASARTEGTITKEGSAVRTLLPSQRIQSQHLGQSDDRRTLPTDGSTKVRTSASRGDQYFASTTEEDFIFSSAKQYPDMATLENREMHERFMREAIAMGEKALASDETPVGCVFVHDGEIIGHGMNDTNKSMNGTRHAEFVGLAEILSNHCPSILRDTDLYVTVEPCIMCASALRQLRIRAVYFGCYNDRFGGTGGVLNIHADSSIDPPYPAYGGIFREEAIMLLRRFYIQENDKAPEPKQKRNRELKTEILPLTKTRIAPGKENVQLSNKYAEGADKPTTPCQ